MTKIEKLFDTSKLVKRKIPEQKEFEDALENELTTFSELIKEGFELTQEERGRKKRFYRDRNWEAVTMSGNMKGLLFDKFPNSMHLDTVGRYYFKKGNKYIIYFKKLNNKLIPTNIKTFHTKKLYGQFAFQFEQEKLPVVFIGYTVNDTWDELTGRYAVCINNNERRWVTDLTDNINTSLNILKRQLSNQDPVDISSLIKPKKNKRSS